MKFKNKKMKEQLIKRKKTPTIKIGVQKKGVLALWVILIISLLFGVYKNFTAIDKHTVYEKEIIKTKIIDTNKVENFVKQFISTYYSWGQTHQEISSRDSNLKKYLTEELQALNADMVRSDIPTRAKVTNSLIWDIKQLQNGNYKVIFSVSQNIFENKKMKNIESSYNVVVHVDNKDNMIIIKNPTLDSKPVKSEYTPSKIESDGSVEPTTVNEINEFIQTFFKIYPKAGEKELSYYIEDNILKPINKDYIFTEIINPTYSKQGNNIIANITVKYLDNETKTIQLSQYKLKLTKIGNWRIIQNQI